MSSCSPAFASGRAAPLLNFLIKTHAASPPIAADHARIDARAEHYGEIAQKIWEFAEVGYKETRSAALLREELRAAGFSDHGERRGNPDGVQRAGGSGGPVIGILGEYDALPGLFQEAVPRKQPLRSTTPGHGCGHNLFGTASAAAAIAVNEWLVEKKLPGTVRFYGCPAEEGGGGKIYMARAGAFADCDVVLHWHPGSDNRASIATTLANITGKFRFRGKAAHAAGSPSKGPLGARCSDALHPRRRAAARACAADHAHPLRHHRMAATRRMSCRPSPRCISICARRT